MHMCRHGYTHKHTQHKEQIQQLTSKIHHQRKTKDLKLHLTQNILQTTFSLQISLSYIKVTLLRVHQYMRTRNQNRSNNTNVCQIYLGMSLVHLSIQSTACPFNAVYHRVKIKTTFLKVAHCPLSVFVVIY